MLDIARYEVVKLYGVRSLATTSFTTFLCHDNVIKKNNNKKWRFGSEDADLMGEGIQGRHTIKQILHAASYSISQFINPWEDNINLGLRPRLISLPSG